MTPPAPPPQVTTRELGKPLPDWKPAHRPVPVPIQGKFVCLEPLGLSHAASLYAADRADTSGESWDYLAYGPFATFEAYADWLQSVVGKPDPFFYAIIDRASGEAKGVASFMRIDPEHGTIEIGHIHFSPALQRTVCASEAIILMMRQAFDLGNRRLEWKCNALNQASIKAANRFGFRFEGVFRNATVVKQRNRDTAWFSVILEEWPDLKARQDSWLNQCEMAGGQQPYSLRNI